ncbi:MAG TPA: hypothetical protein VF228_03355, partial [Iamia sp.]
MVLVSQGTFHNEGLVRISGVFPGVVFGFSPAADAEVKGKATMTLSNPGWFDDITSEPMLSTAAAVLSTGSTLRRLLTDIDQLFDDQRIGGSCVGFSASVLAPGAVGQACALSGSGAQSAVSLSFGPSVSVGVGDGSISGVSLEAGQVMGYRLPQGTTTVGDMGGPFVCFGGSITVATLGVGGSHCWGPQGDTQFDLGTAPFVLQGMHSTYAGISWSTSTVDVSLTVSATYTAVIGCQDWAAIVGRACPVPPKVIGTSTPSAYQSGTNRTMYVYGEHLSEATSVDFVQLGVPTAPACHGIVVDADDLWIEVRLPDHCPLVGDSLIYVTTPRGGDNSEQAFDPGATFTWIEDPPPPP